MKRVWSTLHITIRAGETQLSSQRQQPPSCHRASLIGMSIAAPTKHKMMARKAQATSSQNMVTLQPPTTIATRERIHAVLSSLHLWLLILFGMLESDSWWLAHDLIPSLQVRLEKQRNGSFYFQSWDGFFLSLKLKRQGSPYMYEALGRKKKDKCPPKSALPAQDLQCPQSQLQKHVRPSPGATQTVQQLGPPSRKG